MLKGINLSLVLDLKQLRKLYLCGNCDFNKQITFAILYERPCIVLSKDVGVWVWGGVGLASYLNKYIFSLRDSLIVGWFGVFEERNF